jgi:hypothetical protein
MRRRLHLGLSSLAILAAGVIVTAACLSFDRPGTPATTAAADQPGAWFVQKGCTGCHPVSVYGLWNPAVRAPDLSLAVEDVPRRFGRPLDAFLREPSGTMAMVLAGQVRLTDAEREVAIDKLTEAYAIHTRARGAAPTPVAPLRSH